MSKVAREMVEKAVIDRLFWLTVLIGAVGIWVVVFQNAGLIPPISSSRVQTVTGHVIVDGPVAVNVEEVSQPLDINLHSVVGRPLVESEQGMDIGVSSIKNIVIPIHWGEVSIVR